MYPLFPHAAFHSFEPFPSTFQILQENWDSPSNISLHQVALGSQNTVSNFYTNEDSATNSILSNATHSGPEQSSVSVTQRTLDSFTAEHHIENIDLLKMDCQGFELEILKGALDLLASGCIQIIYSEVLFTPLYQNQAYFEDLIGHLRNYHYQLLALYDGKRSSDGHLLWSNALFSRLKP